MQKRQKTCMTNFTSFMSRMSEFRLLIMYIRYIVPWLYNIYKRKEKISFPKIYGRSMLWKQDICFFNSRFNFLASISIPI